MQVKGKRGLSKRLDKSTAYGQTGNWSKIKGTSHSFTSFRISNKACIALKNNGTIRPRVQRGRSRARARYEDRARREDSYYTNTAVVIA